MTIGIYCIEHTVSGRKYIGKSVNIEQRFSAHKWALKLPKRPKDTNRFLYNAVQKYGLAAFDFRIIEKFDFVDEQLIAERELFWMDYFNSCNSHYGFNLRRDSRTRMIVHPETRALMKVIFLADANPNYGNNWSDEQKKKMSEIALGRHASGRYGDDWKKKIASASTKTWAENPDLKARMAAKVAEKKRKYNFAQYDLCGRLIRVWESVKDIVATNPQYKWQNIYSVCNGYKHTYMGFVWKKELKSA